MMPRTLILLIISFLCCGTQAQNCADVYIHAGLNAKSVGKYKDALKDFALALQCDPSRASAFVDRGTVLEKLGQYLPAVKEYNKAARISPKDPLIYYDRGLA
jgi:tetratricopeptide (TPR) repeat protein